MLKYGPVMRTPWKRSADATSIQIGVDATLGILSQSFTDYNSQLHIFQKIFCGDGFRNFPFGVCMMSSCYDNFCGVNTAASKFDTAVDSYRKRS